MGTPLVISVLLALAVALFAYAILMPRNLDAFAPDNEEEAEDSLILKLTTRISSEMYSALPAGMTPSRGKSNPRVEALLRKSGNPWGLRADEFIFFQYTAGLIGFILGWIVGLVLGPIIGVHWGIILAFFTIFAFFIPYLKYNGEANRRDLEFTRHLPEVLDLLVIPLVAGDDFNTAIRQSLPNMPDGVLKDEFYEVIKAVDTGRTTNEALNHLADRAPNEGVAAFVRAVQEANSLDVPMVETMKARAKASRADFFALIHNKTAALPSKIMMIITPTLIPALILVFIAPAVQSLLSTMGG